MLKCGFIGVFGVAGILVVCVTPLSARPQEPGTEYIFTVNDANSFVFLDLAGVGTVTDQSLLSGWVSLYLGDPTPGSPRVWNVPCVMGRSDLVNLDDLDVVILPGVVEAQIVAGDLRVYDLDIWYQDLDDWNVDPNDWPDPNDAVDPNDAPDPNDISPGDPNDPNYNDPTDPMYPRSVDLTGGGPISSGQLNSEILFFWRFIATIGSDTEAGADLSWSGPFRYWDIQIADAPHLNQTGNGSVQVVLEWQFWVQGDFPLLGTFHMEGEGGLPRSLDLVIERPEKGTVEVTPDVLDPVKMPKYIDGTVVTLTAIPNPDSKGFLNWKIWDPNFPGDDNYMVKDTNTVLTLVMDGDYVVEAKFKCGSASAMMPLGIVLLALTAGVVIRRFR